MIFLILFSPLLPLSSLYIQVLERYLLDFLAKKESYETVKVFLEHHKEPKTLSDAKEAVKQHVQLKDKLNRAELDHLCESMAHVLGKLRPATANPDFQASFQFLEELEVSLRNNLSRLEQLWEIKGSKLDHGLQQKVFEHDSEHMMEWMNQQCTLLSRQLTDIGSDSKSACTARICVEEFRNSTQV